MAAARKPSSSSWTSTASRGAPVARARPKSPLHVCPVESRTEALRQPRRVTNSPEMHEVDRRLFAKHMAVKRRHFDSAGAKRAHYGINFARQHHEVTGRRSLPATER